jgi:hypothetical protein
VAEREFDPERGRAAVMELKALGVRGVLIQAAEQGRISQVVCKMPECYCPKELGGACYFEPRVTPLTDWMPTADHHPTLKSKGGHLTVDNVRLAHRLCNRIHYSIETGHPHAKDLARVKATREATSARLASPHRAQSEAPRQRSDIPAVPPRNRLVGLSHRGVGAGPMEGGDVSDVISFLQAVAQQLLVFAALAPARKLAKRGQ